MVTQRNPWLFDADLPPGLPPAKTQPSKRITFQRQLKLVMNAMACKRLRVVNPFGTLLTQNKLALAFMWDMMSRFSPAAQRAISELIPETRRLADVGCERVVAEQNEWVIKSYYGFEGNEAICGAFVQPARWRKLVECLDPSVWVAQRFFEVRPDAQGMLPNYGVFLLEGEPMGCLYRISKRETNMGATIAPVFVQRDIASSNLQMPAIAGSPVVAQRYELFGDDLAIPATALPLADDPGEPLIRSSGHVPNAGEAWALIDTWMPSGSCWEGLMHRNCALQLFDATLPMPAPLLTPAMERSYARGAALRDELVSRDNEGRDVMVWIDLPGEEAIACAMGLAATYLPVIRIDGFAHPLGTVRMADTLGAMLHYNDARRALYHRPTAPAAIVHDSRRVIDVRTDPRRVLNSYLALVPPARTLLSNGVRRIRAVYEGSEDTTYAGPFGMLLEGFDPRFAREFYDALSQP
jgi:hypothetical protein